MNEYDPEISVTRSLLQAAINELRQWKVAKGGDDQVVLNLEAILNRSALWNYEVPKTSTMIFKVGPSNLVVDE